MKSQFNLPLVVKAEKKLEQTMTINVKKSEIKVAESVKSVRRMQGFANLKTGVEDRKNGRWRIFVHELIFKRGGG